MHRAVTRAPDVFIGIGGNLPSPRWGPPQEVMAQAMAALPAAGIVVTRRSRWYHSAPLPPSAQPTFLNAVFEVETTLTPALLLAKLHAVETVFGRERGPENAARILDLDLLAYGSVVLDQPGGPCLPHPRLHLRTFVLLPLAEVAPAWRHPLLRRTAAELLADLPPDVAAGQHAVPVDDDSPPNGEPPHDAILSLRR